jgi:hypothetical protein
MGNRRPVRLLKMTGLVNLAVPIHRKRVPGDQPLTTGLTFGPSRANQTLTALCASQLTFGVTVSGEFSSSWVECGLFLSGVDDATTTEGDCLPFIEYQSWNDTFKEGIRVFTLAEMDALQNWWFWTWKVCLRSRLLKLLG